MKKLICIIFLFIISFSIFAQNIDSYFCNKIWIPEYYNEIILNKNRDFILTKIPKYKEQPYEFDYSKDIDIFWYDNENIIDICKYEHIGDFNKYLCVNGTPFSVLNIDQQKINLFIITVESWFISEEYFNTEKELGYDWGKSSYTIKKFYLEFDGDYLNIYVNNKKNYLLTYCGYNIYEFNILKEAIKTNIFNISDFKFPRHADGTCDYDESKSISTEQTTTDSVKKKKKK